MTNYVKVNYDPFSGQKKQPEGSMPIEGKRFVKVEGDPFANKVPEESQDLLPSHKPPEEPAQWKSTFSKYARPVLEGGGAAGGAVLGAAAAAPTGPGAAVAGVAGGTLGYAIGKRGADILDEYLGVREPKNLKDTMVETAKDLRTGATLEMGGQVIGAAMVPVLRGGKWAFEKAAESSRSLFSRKGYEESAGRVLRASTSHGDIYAKNAAEAAKIEKEIPGIKFTIGQQSGDPNLIKLERAQIRGTNATVHASEQVASNNEALRSYYEKQFAGKEGIDDTIKAIRGKSDALKEGISTSEAVVAQSAGGMHAPEPQQTGQKIVDVLSEGKRSAKAQAGTLYKAVPESDIPVTDMLKEFDEISKPMTEFEEAGNVPSILKRVREKFPDIPAERRKIIDGPGGESGQIERRSGAPRGTGDRRQASTAAAVETISLKDLQGLRSELIKDYRQAAKLEQQGGTSDRLPSRLSRAIGAVERAIEWEKGSEELKAANRFFRENYAEVFKQGTVGDVLKRGPRGEAIKIPLAQIPSKVWNTSNLSAADDFLKAVDKETAAGIMKDHAAYDLMKSATDVNGRIVNHKLSSWMKNNAPLLDRFGIKGEFSKVFDAQRAADVAKSAADDFERSIAARLLNADPEKAIAKAISGTNTGAAMTDLMKSVAHDKAATAGLKNAFAEHVMTTIQTTAKDIAGQPTISNAAFVKQMRKLRPAINTLYKNEPQKIKALDTMQRAYEIATRNTRSPIGGGSDTAENILTELSKVNMLSRGVSLARGAFRFVKKYSDSQVNDLIAKAIFDPDLAKTLVDGARGTIKPSQLEKVIDSRIIKLDEYRKARFAQATSGALAAGAGE